MTGQNFSAMSPEDRKAWLSDYQQWVTEQLPTISTGGDSEQIKAFEHGLDLISAFSFCRSFVREVRSFREYRGHVKHLRRLVDKVNVEVQKQSTVAVDLNDPALLRPHVGRPTKDEQAARAIAAERERKEREENEPSLFGTGASIPTVSPAAPNTVSGSMGGGSMLHLDQLRWLMSDNLREAVDSIRDLRSQAAEAATRAKQMAEDGKPEEEVAVYAQQSAALTEQYENIYASVDTEMARVYVRLKEDSAFIDGMQKQNVDPSELRTQLRPYWDKVEDKDAFKAEVIAFISDNDPAQAEKRKAEEERQEKIRAAIKYITRKDKENTPKRIEGIEARIKELVSLVGEEEAAPYYAILEAAKANPAPARKNKEEK